MWNPAVWQPPLLRTVRDLTDWPERSQQAACRNALVASTALAERRRQRCEVEEFLADYLARRSEEAQSA